MVFEGVFQNIVNYTAGDQEELPADFFYRIRCRIDHLAFQHTGQGGELVDRDEVKGSDGNHIKCESPTYDDFAWGGTFTTRFSWAVGVVSTRFDNPGGWFIAGPRRRDGVVSYLENFPRVSAGAVQGGFSYFDDPAQQPLLISGSQSLPGSKSLGSTVYHDRWSYEFGSTGLWKALLVDDPYTPEGYEGADNMGAFRFVRSLRYQRDMARMRIVCSEWNDQFNLGTGPVESVEVFTGPVVAVEELSPIPYKDATFYPRSFLVRDSDLERGHTWSSFDLLVEPVFSAYLIETFEVALSVAPNTYYIRETRECEYDEEEDCSREDGVTQYTRVCDVRGELRIDGEVYAEWLAAKQISRERFYLPKDSNLADVSFNTSLGGNVKAHGRTAPGSLSITVEQTVPSYWGWECCEGREVLYPSEEPKVTHAITLDRHSLPVIGKGGLSYQVFGFEDVTQVGNQLTFTVIGRRV